MLKPFEKLRGCTLAARDGEIGEVREFYFDDQQWSVRYFVISTGSWMNGRSVLVAPSALREVDAEARTIATDMTKEQVRNSPPLASDKPVSRQYEAELHRHYAWSPYWVMPAAAGLGAFAPALTAQQQSFAKPTPPEPSEAQGDPHQRSSGEIVNRYTLHAQDGEIGTVDDFVLDEQWRVRYLVVRTGIWPFGQSSLLAPDSIETISSDSWEIFINLPRSAIKDAPPYDSSSTISRAYEQRLHDHYARSDYWEAVEAAR